jgi:hypothetical protein
MVGSLKSQFLKDHQLVKIIFSCTYCCRNQRNLFGWDKFSAAIVSLEEYTSKLNNVARLTWKCYQPNIVVKTREHSRGTPHTSPRALQKGKLISNSLEILSLCIQSLPTRSNARGTLAYANVLLLVGPKNQYPYIHIFLSTVSYHIMWRCGWEWRRYIP